jgi:hypothetical protein
VALPVDERGRVSTGEGSELGNTSEST